MFRLFMSTLFESVHLVSKTEYNQHMVTSIELPAVIMPKETFVLALQWDESLGPSNRFTIHGLWTDMHTTVAHPASCLISTWQDLYRIAKGNTEIWKNMTRLWSSFQTKMSLRSSSLANKLFWQKQWDKHGRTVINLISDCRGECNENNHVLDYFKTTLSLAERYNPHAILQRHNIEPGYSYSLQSIAQAINEELGCKVDIKLNVKSSFEVRIYLQACNRDFKPVDSYCSSYSDIWVDYPEKF